MHHRSQEHANDGSIRIQTKDILGFSSVNNHDHIEDSVLLTMSMSMSSEQKARHERLVGQEYLDKIQESINCV